MKKSKIVVVVLAFLILFVVSGCTGSSSSKRDWKQDAYEQGYYKGTDGKWYHK